MPRFLGQAWPQEFRDHLVTDVRLNSTKYGKYSAQQRRIYRTFVSGVPAHALMKALLAAARERPNRAEFERLVDRCRRHIEESNEEPASALAMFSQPSS